MRSYAVIPPILLDERQRRLTYRNNNGLIEDFAAEYKERTLFNVWTDHEAEVFKVNLNIILKRSLYKEKNIFIY